MAFWADIYPERTESTYILGSVLALGINDHGCQHGMKPQSSRLSFPETSLLPGKWNTQQFHKLLGMGIDCFLIVLGEGKPERLPRLGTLTPNTELSWRADILPKLQTQELCSRPKVLGDLKPRARKLLDFLLASILATPLGSSFCFMRAFPVL